ncbi:MAG: hypothetical protein H7210_11595 [Pyrinomonadaceae bacterium]|nr:hypothetical protein [Phycisphaerales bacterium]
MSESTPLPDLSLIKAEQAPPGGCDDADSVALGEDAFHKIEWAKAELEDFKQEVANRSRYTSRLFWLMVGWITVVLGILVATAVETPSTYADPASGRAPGVFWEWIGAFKLSDPVLMALIGGTTANVIGLFLIVTTYLFPKRDK